jgi:hypothetical protein
MLGERIAPEPSLLPRASAQRAEMFGLITEIASEGGFAWLRRLSLIGMLFAASDDSKARRTPEVLAARYGYSPPGGGTGGGRLRRYPEHAGGKATGPGGGGQRLFRR